MKQFLEQSESDTISYVKARSLGPVVVFLMEILEPFNKILSSMLTVATPLLNIFFKSDSLDAWRDFLKDGPKEDLKKKLLEKN